MAVSKNSTNIFIDSLTKDSAGLELAQALNNGLHLSPETLFRLGIALSDTGVANHLQSAILGTGVLSARDIQYLTDGFASADVAAEIVTIAGIAGLVPLPVNVSMPTGFTSTVTRDPDTQQQSAALAMPAGSTFPSTGPGAYFEIQNAGDANKYYVWYKVLGGTNTDPAPAGFTGIEVDILPGDSAIAIANKTYAATNGFLIAMTSTVSSNVVTIVANAALVATPTFSLAAGTYAGTQSVSLASATPGATLYYTLNGSTPTISSTIYVAPISVGSSETIKVLGVKSGFGNSLIASAAYTITGSPGVATNLFWTTQPSTAKAGVAFATQPIITIRDASNATVTSGPDATALITITLLTGTGALAGTVSMNAVAGVANFVGKGLNVTVFGNKVLRATKADTTGGGGTPSFTADSALLNISNNLSAVNLLTAGNYTILSEAGITDAGSSVITGDIAVSPIAHTAITGFSLILDGGGTFSTSAKVVSPGKVYAADYAAPTPANLTQAVSDKNTAYSDAAGRTSPDFTNLGSGEIGGLTLTPGLYKWTTGVTISNDVTISGGVNDVFIFQISGTLTMSAAKNIILSGGVKAENIFWQMSGATTIGTTCVFKGILLGATGLTLQTNASLDGHMYAGTAVALDSNAVTKKP